jgi:hypothetical protein
MWDLQADRLKLLAVPLPLISPPNGVAAPIPDRHLREVQELLLPALALAVHGLCLESNS